MTLRLWQAAILLGLLAPAATWAQRAPSANRTSNATNNAETAQPDTQTQTQTQTQSRTTRHAGEFRSFHSFTSPPAL
jgi:hypothetical protein